MSAEPRERPCEAVLVPSQMASAVEGYSWARDMVGESGGVVYRLHGKPGAADLYLKHGRVAVAEDLADEAARLNWLAGRIPTPAVVQFERAGQDAWLLMEAMPGETAYQVLEANPDAAPSVVDALALFLRRFHAIPAGECPFNSDHHSRLLLARARMEAGVVDVEDFDDERQGWSAERVWEAMQALASFQAEPVVTHGDFSLDNLLMRDGAVVGCIDVGRVGIADRYQDLAILWNGLGEFGAPLQGRLFEQYGAACVDHGRLEFHLVLDEFF